MSDHSRQAPSTTRRPRWGFPASSSLLSCTLLLSFSLLLGPGGRPAAAQGGPGGPGGPGQGNQDGAIGVAIIFPQGITGVQLTASYGDPKDAVIFTDDGTLAVDQAGDGEWWAVLELRPNGSEISISGFAGGLPIRQTEPVRVPMAWTSTTWPMTFLAVNDGNRYRLERTLSSSLPELSASSGGGGGSAAAAGLGFSAASLILLWGALGLTIGGVASLRRAILRS